jgi:hypothetical protein
VASPTPPEERPPDFTGARDQACNTCAHVYPGHSFCQAFDDDGEGIPVYILNGLSKRLEPVEGDHGIQYEYAPELGPKPRWAP